MDPAAVGNVNHVGDIVAGLFGQRGLKATRGMVDALLPEELLAETPLIAKYNLVDHAFSDQISAVEGNNGGLMFNADLPKTMKMGNRQVSMRVQKTGYMKNFQTGDPLQPAMLHREMNRMANRPWAHPIMQNIDMAPDELRQHVVNNVLGAQGNQQELKMFARNVSDNRGHIVGVDSTTERARADHAQTMIDHVNAVFTGKNGELNRDLLDKAGRGETISFDDVHNLTPEQLPPSVLGDDVLGVKSNWADAVRDAVEKGFRGTGRIVNWMARQPLWTHNFAVAAREARPNLARMFPEATPEELDRLVAQTAEQRAYRMTAPFIHDPQLRTQFESTYQNLMPFMFAQRQFYKRWGLSFIHSPEAFHKAQLFYNGFQNAGIVQYDANGVPYYHYPGTGAMMEVLNLVAGPMFGQLPSVPAAVGFDGKVRNTIAGLNETGPSFGPWVSLPVNAVATHFHSTKFDSFARLLLGDQGFNPNQHFDMHLFSQVVPGIPGKAGVFVESVFGPEPETTDSQYGSAALQASQLLQANPATAMSPNASPGEQATFIRRAVNQAKIILLGRLFMGATVPASPQLDLDPNNLHKDFKKLVAKYGVEEGQKIFLTEHPDDDAYTVYGSKDAGGGAYLPAYKGTEKFLMGHADFLKAYNTAAPYFIPYNPVNKSFSIEAYNEQNQLGMRKAKNFLGIGGVADSLATAHDANTYWQAYDVYQQTLHDNPQMKTIINKNWAQWRDPFMLSHPLLAHDLSDGGSAQKKLTTLDNITYALNDHKVPKGAQTEMMRTVMDTWNDYLDQTAQYKNKNGGAYTYLRNNLKQQTMTALSNYVQQNPDVSPLYNNLIRPLLDPGANAVGG